MAPTLHLFLPGQKMSHLLWSEPSPGNMLPVTSPEGRATEGGTFESGDLLLVRQGVDEVQEPRDPSEDLTSSASQLPHE